jgi:hypothetical protein
MDGRHCPLIQDLELYRDPISCIEQFNINKRQGAVQMGAYVSNQLGINRPHPLLPGSRTLVKELYLCGSSSGNGGRVDGASGCIAAKAPMSLSTASRSSALGPQHRRRDEGFEGTPSLHARGGKGPGTAGPPLTCIKIALAAPWSHASRTIGGLP